MNSIHEFVMRGGQMVTAGQMDACRRELPLLKVKAETSDTTGIPHFRKQTLFLVRYAEDVLEGVYGCSDRSGDDCRGGETVSTKSERAGCFDAGLHWLVQV